MTNAPRVADRCRERRAALPRLCGVAMVISTLCAGCGGSESDPGEPLHVEQLAAGFPDFMGRHADGTVVRWGFDDAVPPKSTPASRIPGLGGVVDISGEFGTFCA